MIKSIAIYGGAFDPPHKSHISLINYLQTLQFIDQVWLLPCGDRNDKKLLLPKDIRFSLLQRIFHLNSKIKVVSYQIQTSKKLGRMVQTYQLLQELSKKFQNFKFHFVIGADLIKDLQSWGHGKQLKQKFDFIIFKRFGYQIIQDNLPDKYKMCQYQLQQMSSSSLKRVIWDQKLSKNQKILLIQKYLPIQALKCLEDQKLV